MELENIYVICDENSDASSNGFFILLQFLYISIRKLNLNHKKNVHQLLLLTIMYKTVI